MLNFSAYFFFLLDFHLYLLFYWLCIVHIFLIYICNISFLIDWWDNDNHIILKEGTDPINVHPYQYLHTQKEETECMIADMLDAGIVQINVSSFSSPLILVKKGELKGFCEFVVMSFGLTNALRLEIICLRTSF